MAVRRALLIGVERYQALPMLPASRADVVRLNAVLSAKEIGDYDVRTLVNPSADEVRRAVTDFFASAREPDEQRLLYFAGHGVTDSTGHLFLGMTDTDPDLLAVTGVSAEFVRNQAKRSLANTVLLILDCCHSGAFGFRERLLHDAEDVFAPAPRNQAVLTSTTALEPSYWDSDGKTSVFTRAVAEGLSQGTADLDNDGRISLTELYQYTHRRLQVEAPGQAPTLSVSGAAGVALIARTRRASSGEDFARPVPTPVRPVRRSRLAAFTEGIGTVFDSFGGIAGHPLSVKLSWDMAIM